MVIVIGLLTSNRDFILGGVEYVYEKEVIKEVEVVPDWASDPEAVKAAQDVIRRKELEAEKEQLIKEWEAATIEHENQKKDFLERKEKIEKELGVFWKDVENVKRLIRHTFPEEPATALEVARLESSFKMQQSRHIYTRDNLRLGIKAGTRERSYCIFQIHEPAHKETIERLGLEDFKTNIESCVKMARVVYEQAGNSFKPWTVYTNTIAMR